MALGLTGGCKNASWDFFGGSPVEFVLCARFSLDGRGGSVRFDDKVLCARLGAAGRGGVLTLDNPIHLL